LRSGVVRQGGGRVRRGRAGVAELFQQRQLHRRAGLRQYHRTAGGQRNSNQPGSESGRDLRDDLRLRYRAEHAGLLRMPGDGRRSVDFPNQHQPRAEPGRIIVDLDGRLDPYSLDAAQFDTGTSARPRYLLRSHDQRLLRPGGIARRQHADASQRIGRLGESHPGHSDNRE
jgi:hypothetical protein